MNNNFIMNFKLLEMNYLWVTVSLTSKVFSHQIKYLGSNLAYIKKLISFLAK